MKHFCFSFVSVFILVVRTAFVLRHVILAECWKLTFSRPTQRIRRRNASDDTEGPKWQRHVSSDTVCELRSNQRYSNNLVPYCDFWIETSW